LKGSEARTRIVFRITSPGRTRPRFKTEGVTVTADCTVAVTEIGMVGTAGSLVRRVISSRNGPVPSVGLSVAIKVNWDEPGDVLWTLAVTSLERVLIRAMAKFGDPPV